MSEIEELKQRMAELDEVVKAVAHIGIDWGYGVYELEQKHIDTARELYESKNQQPAKEQG
jgi:hypothetical protein